MRVKELNDIVRKVANILFKDPSSLESHNMTFTLISCFLGKQTSFRTNAKDSAFLWIAFEKNIGSFFCLINTIAGLDSGCQVVSEFIVLSKIIGEFLKPAEPVFRP
jgi:uncharacterized protein YozE (UPF0346 family)